MPANLAQLRGAAARSKRAVKTNGPAVMRTSVTIAHHSRIRLRRPQTHRCWHRVCLVKSLTKCCLSGASLHLTDAGSDAGRGRGRRHRRRVLFIVKNYEGDVMNFDMARELSDKVIATVLTNDDVAVEKSSYSTGRRGVAGTLIVEKIVGAAAEAGRDLEALKAIGDSVNACTRSMGVALSSCTVPAAGKPTFEIGEDEMEIGVGIHGEPGRRRVKLMRADAIAAEMVTAILGDLGSEARGEAILLVNGFGGTPLMELYLIYGIVRRLIEAAGITATRSLVGNYVTSLEMAGCSVTLSMLDGETKRLWDAPVHAPALRWGA